MKRIFVIGFNKMATFAIHKFFVRNGLRSAHWKKGKLALAIVNNKAAFRDPLFGIAGYEAYTDLELVNSKEYPLIESYKEFPYLHAWYPDSYFILNTRNPERWINSRLNHGKGDYLNWYKRHYSTSDENVVIRRWRLDFYNHHYNVLKYFNDKPGRLLVFDIENDDAGSIAQFLSKDYDIDPRLWRVENQTQSQDARPGIQEISMPSSK